MQYVLRTHRRVNFPIGPEETKPYVDYAQLLKSLCFSLEFERRLPTFANIGKQDKGYAGNAQTSRTLRIGRPGTDMAWFSFTPCGFWQWRFSTCLVGGLSNCEVGIGLDLHKLSLTNA